MDEIRKCLTPADKAYLSDLWQDKSRLNALKSVLSHRQLKLAQISATAAPDFNFVLQNRGKIEEDNWFIKFLQYNFEEGEKLRKLASKQTE